MKRKYIKPDVEKTMFSVEDIMTESGMATFNFVNNVEAGSAEEELYNMYSQLSPSPNANVSIFTW